MTRPTVRRILVALDASPHSHAALQEAARLAAGLEAELTGIFVLDAELLRFSGLPLARETGMTSASRRALDPQSMERALRAQAERARTALEAIARQQGLRSTFRLLRGNVAGELVSAAADADLIAMGVIGHMGLAGKRLGSTVRQMRALARCSLLLAPGPHADGRVLVVCSETADSASGLALAVRLADQRGTGLVVLLCGDESARGRLRAEVEARLAESPVEVALIEETEEGVEAVRRLVGKSGAGLVVMGQDCPLVVDHEDALCSLGCPVLLARTREPTARA